MMLLPGTMNCSLALLEPNDFANHRDDRAAEERICLPAPLQHPNILLQPLQASDAVGTEPRGVSTSGQQEGAAF